MKAAGGYIGLRKDDEEYEDDQPLRKRSSMSRTRKFITKPTLTPSSSTQPTKTLNKGGKKISVNQRLLSSVL